MKQDAKKKPGRAAFGGYTFLEYRLSTVDKERLEALDIDAEFPFTGIAGLVSQGYKVSFSEDPRNSTCICALTDNRNESPFFKSILTGRGGTAAKAWAALCYKHFYLAQEDWANISKVDLDQGWG